MSKDKPLFAFFGTPRLATIVLDALEARGFLPALVVTAPDKPRGRGLEPTPCPAKRWALERGIDVISPASLKDASLTEELANTPWDVFLVAAYGKLIPKAMLDIPRRGVLNVHPSLLPKFRGPSPITSAILEDAHPIGVTIMLLTEGMDEGPIVAQATVDIEEEAWPLKGQDLEDLLAAEGGTLLAEVLPPWLAGEIEPVPQDLPAGGQGANLATYTKKFTDANALIDLAASPRQNFLKIRAFDTNPRAYFLSPKGKRVIITEAEFVDGKLEILRVLPEGKKEMLYADFLRGQKS